MCKIEDYLKKLDELDPQEFEGMSCDSYMQRNVVAINSLYEYEKEYVKLFKEYTGQDELDTEDLEFMNNYEGNGLYDFWLGNDGIYNYLYKLDTAIKELELLNK